MIRRFFVLFLIARVVSAEAPDAALADAAAAIAKAHRRADALAPTEPRAASAVLEQALAIALPPGEPAWQLRADLHARRSELLLAAGAPTESLQAARSGLAEASGRPPSALTTLLKLREAEALEALGQDAEAVAAYGEAIAIARRLLAAQRPSEDP